jgi:type III secretion protein T
MASFDANIMQWLGRFDPFVLLTLALASCRFFGFFLTFPLFSWLNITGILRVALSIALALGLGAAPAGKDFPAADAQAFVLLALLAKEIVIGSILGMLCGLPVWGAQAAGDILDSYRGANASSIFDPLNTAEVSVMGQLNSFLVMSWLVSSGGLRIIFDMLYTSFSAIEITAFAPLFDQSLMAMTRWFMGSIAELSLSIAAPLLIVMLITELVIGAVGRVSKQMSTSELSSMSKSIAALLSLPIYGAFVYTFSEAGFKTTVSSIFAYVQGSR